MIDACNISEQIFFVDGITFNLDNTPMNIERSPFYKNAG